MATLLRSLCAAMGVVFTALAALQPFDPQGLSWIMGFGYVAMCSLCGSLNIEIKWPSVAGAAALAMWLWRLQPHEAGPTGVAAVAVERETIGLIFGVAALLFVALSEDRRRLSS